MGLLNAIEGEINKFSNLLKNPFEQNETVDFSKPDFKSGFKILELIDGKKDGELVVLAGNWMPQVPFTFGGSVRMKKEFYSGYSEPTVQVFGPEENDITINGMFKDKKFQDINLRNVSTEIQQQIDAIRIRGNIVRLELGEFVRYAVIKETKFDMERLTRIGYSITFSIIGFNAPKNAKYLQRKSEVPFGINKELIDIATKFNLDASNIPESTPESIAGLINGLINDVAEVISTVTNFIDEIFSTIQDIKSAVNRALGLIKYAQQKLRSYKRQVGALFSFDPIISIAGRYDSARYSSSTISTASSMTSFLERLRLQFSSIINDLPLARSLVRDGDTLQKISIKYYGNADSWKKIYDYNDLTSTELSAGILLDIPRL